MRSKAAAVLALLFSSTAGLACTALLGDFSVGEATAPTDGGGATPDGESAADGGPGSSDGSSGDAAVDAGPPTPDGGFLNLWTFGSTNTSPPSNMRVAYDGQGNLYVLFAYSLANLDVLGTSLTPVGAFDMGLVKIAPTGKPVWVKSYGSQAYDYPGGLAVAPNGDVYISGGTEGASIDFGGTAGTLTRRSSRYLGWIAKINGADGAPVKAISIDGVGQHQGASCQALSLRGPHVVAMCNAFGQTVWPTVTGAPITITPPDGPNGGTSGFVIADLDPELVTRWANGFGTDGNDVGANVTVAPNFDTFFVSTSFSSSTSSPALPFTDTKATVSLPFGGGQQLAVVGRLAGGTGSAVWAKPFGGGVTLNGVGVDNTGRVVAAGGLTGSLTVPGRTLTSAGMADYLLLGFDGANGNVTTSRLFGGAGADEARAITIDAWGSPAIAGTYRSTNMMVDGIQLTDPLGNATSGFVTRTSPNLDAFWVGGFTTGLTDTLLQAWSVASDPGSGRVAAAGTFKGVINFGDGNPVRSELNGGAYNVWVVQRRP